MYNFVYFSGKFNNTQFPELINVKNKLINFYQFEDTIRVMQQIKGDIYLYKGRILRYFFYRTAIKIKNIGEFQILYMFNLLKRDDKNYLEFSTNINSDNVMIPNEDKLKIEKDILQRLPKNELQKLEDKDLVFFDFLPHVYDFDILESSIWINETNSEFYRNNWSRIKAALSDLVTSEKDWQVFYKTSIFTIYCYEIKGINLYFDYYKLNNKEYFILHSFNVSDKSFFMQKVSEIYITINNETDTKNILKTIGRRAYLNHILLEDDQVYEKDKWASIEKDKESNLALSKEEENILTEQKLPLFVNGQAGSGKSTILYYLLAQYISRHLENEGYKSIKFLTYSEHLNKRARENVKNIFNTNPNFEAQNQLFMLSEKDIDNCFSPFQKYIISNIIGKNERFVEENYVDFSRFRKWLLNDDENMFEANFCRLPKKEKFTPEIIWFVIRTFIKGYNSKAIMNYEEYKRIATKDKVIDEDIYAFIYSNIWDKWYKQLTTKYWDDQDLVREAINILENNVTKGKEKFAIILCDEAQDFTRLEINFILKMYKYLNYDLSRQLIIPLAFAGDPYQTINPTGFSFGRLKDAFYSEFKEYNFCSPLSTTELTLNFRSVQQIVHLANFIQLIRKYSLGIEELKPQHYVKDGDEENIPIVFQLEKNINQSKMNLLDWDIILVPNGKIVELKNDDYLKKMFDGNSAPNIFNVFDFKGDERDTVIIYKFGEYYLQNIKIPINKLFNSSIEEQNVIYSLKNFFNLLYVAVTRAKEKLIIIDTKEGVELFWKYFTLNTVNEILKKENATSHLDEWKTYFKLCNLKLVSEGDSFNFKSKTELEKNEFAEKMFIKGKDERSSDYLKRAAETFHKLGKTSKEKESYAYYYECIYLYEKAAELFEEIQLYNKAIELYWKISNWSKIISITERIQQDKFNLINLIAKFMDGQTIDVLNTFEKLNSNTILFNEYNWDSIIIKLYNYSMKNLTIIFSQDPEKAKKIYRNLIDYFSDTRFNALIGYYYFLKKDFYEAVNLWDKFKDLQDVKNDFWIAKAEIAKSIDEKFMCFSKVDNHSSYVINYFESQELLFENMNDTSCEILVNSYSFSKDYVKFIKYSVMKLRLINDRKDQYERKYLVDKVNNIINELNKLDFEGIVGLRLIDLYEMLYFTINNDFLVAANLFTKLILLINNYSSQTFKSINKTFERIFDKISKDVQNSGNNQDFKDVKEKEIINLLEFYVANLHNPMFYYFDLLKVEKGKIASIKYYHNKIKLLVDDISNTKYKFMNEIFGNNPVYKILLDSTQEEPESYLVKEFNNFNDKFYSIIKDIELNQRKQIENKAPYDLLLNEVTKMKFSSFIISIKANKTINELKINQKDFGFIIIELERQITNPNLKAFENIMDAISYVQSNVSENQLRGFNDSLKKTLSKINNVFQINQKLEPLDSIYSLLGESVENVNEKIILLSKVLLYSDSFLSADLLLSNLSKNSNLANVFLNYLRFVGISKKSSLIVNDFLTRFYLKTGLYKKIENNEFIGIIEDIKLETLFNGFDIVSVDSGLLNKYKFFRWLFTKIDKLELVEFKKEAKDKLILSLEKRLKELKKAEDDNIFVDEFFYFNDASKLTAELNLLKSNTKMLNEAIESIGSAEEMIEDENTVSYTNNDNIDLINTEVIEVKLIKGETKKIGNYHFYFVSDKGKNIKFKYINDENCEFTQVDLFNRVLKSNEEIINNNGNVFTIEYLNCQLKFIDAISFEVLNNRQKYIIIEDDREILK